jgi:hypothetical protein
VKDGSYDTHQGFRPRRHHCRRSRRGDGVCFEITELQATVDGLAADGYGLVGGIGQYENDWLMTYVRGPEGIVVALAERIG